MTKTQKITEFRVSWQADHEQYWQGHGIATTDYTHCATGCGNTLREAFEDAIEQFIDQSIDFEGFGEIEAEIGLEEAILKELTAQVKEPEMLDMGIVESECPVKGDHKEVSIEECKTAYAGKCICESAADCAVCAGEWHFYVSVDVKVEEIDANQ